MDLLVALLAGIFTLGLVVIVHELGHFLVCKAFGVYVKTFSVGMGPKIVVRQWGETEYALSLIPFGGYVKMAGEGMMEEIQNTGTGEQRKYPLGTEAGNRERDGQEKDIPEDRKFLNKPPGQRFLVFVAGPLFNLILAYMIFTGLSLHQGELVDQIVEIGTVEPGGPADEAGLLPGDFFVAVDGEPVMGWYGMRQAVFRAAGLDEEDGRQRSVLVTVDRAGYAITTEIMPVPESDGTWTLGCEAHDNVIGRVQRNGPAARAGLQRGDRIVMLDGRPIRSFRQILQIIEVSAERPLAIAWMRHDQLMEATIVPEAYEVMPDSLAGRIHVMRLHEHRNLGLLEGLVAGHRLTWFYFSQTVQALWSMVYERRGLEGVGGPIRIAQMAGEMARWGFDRLLFFIAWFSVNLFLLNMLPIPVLDGGHVMFLVFEVVRGKPVPERVHGIATQLGLITLLLFMVVVLVREGVGCFTG